MAEVGRPGVIVYDSNVCAGCGVCEVMCSLSHEGAVRPALSRSHIIREPFTAKHKYFICQQCHSPKCYSACPLKDKAYESIIRPGSFLSMKVNAPAAEYALRPVRLTHPE